MVPFNKPFITGLELDYIQDAITRGKISGNGYYTKLCQRVLEQRYAFTRSYLTSSCTDALEMCALLINIQPGDEVIMPSYTFVSTANAFVLRGAKIIFVDSRKDHPGMDENSVERLITEKTKAIVVVHYAGVACDMDKIMSLANSYSLYVVEDAAHAIDSYYTGKTGVRRALGGIGHLSAFSFHETKNIISGEGGLLVVNDDNLVERAEIIWEKGTNRSSFYRGEVDKYNWVDIGSSFLPSDMTAAFLFAQLEQIELIQARRREIWSLYAKEFQKIADNEKVQLPYIPEFAENNGHMYYLVFSSIALRDYVMRSLSQAGYNSVFHYLGLHSSPFIIDRTTSEDLPLVQYYSDGLLRLPFFFELNDYQIKEISDVVLKAIEEF